MVKKNVIDRLKTYKYNTLLTLVIFILFLLCGYSNSNKDYDIYLKGFRIWLNNGIYVVNNEQYMHIDDLTSIFADNVYHDKISGKLIITTYNKLKKIETSDNQYVIKENNNKYCNINKFMSELGYDVAVVKNKIYVLDNEQAQGTIINNRTELYDVTNNNVLCHLTKENPVKVYVNERVKGKGNKVVNVAVMVNNTTYYGYVLKQNIQYEHELQQIQNNTEKVILVKSDEKLLENTDISKVDMVAINMYRLSGVNSLTKLDYTNNVSKKVGVLATINNGQKSSNYDQEIVTRMLNSESNRYEIIKQIANNVANLAGVNLDFSNFKASDKENYTQFIKELAAVLHSKAKILVVNVPSTQYIDIEKIATVADYIVVQLYGERTLASKTSGPISSINYVDDSIQDIINKSTTVDKVILEIPTYTILWTERRGTVINAEKYTMKTMEAYLEENGIQAQLDSISGQNYINYTKGITTYKMWLEDQYSIMEKAKLVNKYNLAGISIYKSGMESKTIYNSISTVLNK